METVSCQALFSLTGTVQELSGPICFDEAGTEECHLMIRLLDGASKSHPLQVSSK